MTQIFIDLQKEGHFLIQRGQGIMKMSLLFIQVLQEAKKLAKRKSERFLKHLVC